MTPEDQQIAVAVACGWSIEDSPVWGNRHIHKPDGTVIRPTDPRVPLLSLLPDYLNDLNAMHEVEERLSATDRDTYQTWLSRIVEREHRMSPISWLCLNAAAAPRAEAFLRTLGLWVK